MINRLTPIIVQKEHEVRLLKEAMANEAAHSCLSVAAIQNKNLFAQALATPKLSVIAEIKRRSPSKGKLANIPDAAVLAREYADANADAISVLTDETFFSGSLADLREVKATVMQPILRKDFIIDPIQIKQSVAAGANAILLIVAVLQGKTQNLIECAHGLGLDVLVEIHDESELEIALQSDARIIGINNRCLSNFEVDTAQALRLREKIPASILTVAESGITHPTLAREYHAAGFDAVLIGEALVKSDNVKAFIEACHG